MKKLFFFLSFLIFASALNAHFFAYQKWVNPKTGQILEEYYDVHIPNPENSDAEQQKNFVVDAKRYTDDLLVLVEDGVSIRGMRKGEKLSPSPLKDLYSVCSKNNIETVNFDCRDFSRILGKSERDIYDETLGTHSEYDDGLILNDFYASITRSYKEIYRAILSANRFMSLVFNDLGIYGWLLCDAQALHEIHTTNKKRIKLAAGAAHIRNINHYISKLGWIPETPIINKVSKKITGKLAILDHLHFDYHKVPSIAMQNFFAIDAVEQCETAYKQLLPLNLAEIHKQRDAQQVAAVAIRSKL